MKINKSDLKFFEKNGYLVINNLISKKELGQISNRLKELEKKQKDGRGLNEPGTKKSLVHSLHKDQKLKKIIEEKKWFKKINCELLNCDEIFTWNAKSNLKHKWIGSVEYYHQDYIYWKGLGFKSSNMLNCMIFVDDHSHYNAGLWVFPKSHKKMYKHEKFLNINSLQKYFVSPEILSKLNKKNPAVSIKAKAGSCIFFHSKLIHGSSHNISPNDRRILLYDVSSLKDFKNAKKDKINSFNRKLRIKYEIKQLQKRIDLIN
tara:strand:+ start:2363 stop:3145 length:783 start_codon:yes stop_codon:yes gene_type:complete